LAKVGLEEYGLNNISLMNNRTWAEAEVTQNSQPSLSLSRWLLLFPVGKMLQFLREKTQDFLIFLKTFS